MDMVALSLHPHACSYIFTLLSLILGPPVLYNTMYTLVQILHMTYERLKVKYLHFWSAAEVSVRCVLSWWSMYRCQNVTSHHAVSSHDTVMHTVIQSYCHTVMESRVGTVAPCSGVPKQSDSSPIVTVSHGPGHIWTPGYLSLSHYRQRLQGAYRFYHECIIGFPNFNMYAVIIAK